MTSFPSPARRATATSDLHARSFARFLQTDIAPEARADAGLDGVLRAHLAVTSANGLVALSYQGHRFETPRYDAAECVRRGATFAAPLKVLVQYAIWEGDGDTRMLCDVKEQEVYFGEVPLLTAGGCFVFEGAERAPLLTARDDGHRLRLRAAGEHLADAFAEGLSVLTDKARVFLEKSIARGSPETVMPHDLLNARPLFRAFAKLLTKSSRVVAVDDGNPLARAAQAWRFDADDDDTRQALEGARASRWITRDGARAMLSPDAVVDDDGVLDGEATGDARPLAMRVGGDGDALCRALPLAEASAWKGEGLALGRPTSVRWNASLAAETCRVSAEGARALRSVHRTVLDVWVRDTRLGVQEVVRDVPGVDAKSLRHLDASGIVELGATVEPGEVLVGVVSPCDDGTMRDEAVRATARVTVTGVEMFLRRGRERCARHTAIVEAMKRALEAERDAHLATLTAQGADEAQRESVRARYDDKLYALDRGDDLPPGVVGRTRLALREERAVQCGDVLADGEGRRWTVCEVGAVEGAEVELAGHGTARDVYLMKLRAEAVTKKKRAPRKKRSA